MSAEVPPKPVVPAEEAAAPAKALDALAEPTILDKARDMAKPYLDQVDKTTRPLVEKVTASTRPYTDAAFAKGKEFVDYIEGTGPKPTATEKALDPTTPAVPVASTSTAPGTGTSTAEVTAKANELGENIKNTFTQGLTTVQSTITQLSNTIDSKTASGDKPGIITQMSNAVHKGVETVGKAMNEVPQPGVQTTTNAPAVIPPPL